MSDELQRPSVIDLETLLTPFEGENPSGVDVKYSGIYDQIREARRSDVDINQGEWKTDLKTADYQKVLDLSVPCIASTSKDLQIGVWLLEALTRKHGLVGLRDGLKLVTGLQERFWDTLFPEIDEGDMEARGNAFSWADREVAEAALKAPLTGGAGLSFRDWERALALTINETTGGDQADAIREEIARAESAGGITPDRWAKEVSGTKRSEMESTAATMDECWAAFNELNQVIDEKFDRNQTPGLSVLRKSLENVTVEIKKLLELKRAEEPDPADFFTEHEEGSDDPGDGGEGRGARTGAIKNRQDALARLNEIAVFFQGTEPHSPVSYLVQRAVKWGNMPLELWLQEVIKDQGVLFNLKEMLGIGGSEETYQ